MLFAAVYAEAHIYNKAFLLLKPCNNGSEEIFFVLVLNIVIYAFTVLGKHIGQKQLVQLRRTFAGLYDLSDEEARAKKVGGGTTLYYFKEMGRPTVAQWLEKTRKPMLVMQGEKDVQVKAAVDFALYQELLGNRENVTFRLYPGLNHAFVSAISDSIADAKKEFTPERHIGAEVLEDIAGWIKVL